MNIHPLGIAFVSILLSSSAQLMLKSGVSDAGVQRAMASGDKMVVALALATSSAVIGGLMLFGASVILWLFTLARLPLSVAYPLVSLGFAFTVIGSAWLLGEKIAPLQAIGTVIIIGGCMLVARSA